MADHSCPCATPRDAGAETGERCPVKTVVATRTALSYVAITTLWVVLGDWVLFALGHGSPWQIPWSVAKGALFVLATTWLLYALLRRHARRCEAETEQWKAALRARQAEGELLKSELAKAESTSVALENAEVRLRILLRAIEQSPVSIVITDTSGRIDYVNPKFTQLTGYSFDEVIGLNPRFLKSGEITADGYRDLWSTILAGREWRGEFHNRKKNGELFWESVAISPVLDRAERITHFVAVKEDITARKEASRALRESEEMYRTLVIASPDPIMVIDRKGRVEFVSPRGREVFGCAAEERVAGRDMLQAVAPGDRARAKADFLEVLQEGRMRSEEYGLLRGDGGECRAEVHIAPLRAPDGTVRGIVVIARDVTERRRVATKLQASEERFREVVETIAEVFWVFDPASDRFIYVSPSFEKIWGRRCDEACTSRNVWMQSLYPDDRVRIVAAFASKLGNARYDEVYRIVRPDGVVRWIRDQAFPVQDPDGRISRVVGAAEDITEKKEIERQFLRAQRLEAIGTLASGIAHDMNNILAPMLVAPTLLKDRLHAPADRQLLVMLEQSAQRGAAIVRQLLAFSRGTESERGPVQIGHLLKEMLNIMRETFPREIVVQCDGAGELPAINCDPTQIHQVLMNLCVNARDAMPHGGCLKFGAVPIELDQGGNLLHPAARVGHYIKITVEDTGHGIPPEIIERIFDPFFTTKEIGKGTGLGLSTVLGIVTAHEGFVLVDSAEGRGSAFNVYLPATEIGTHKDTSEKAAPFTRGRGEMILVVDDEESLREATRLLLEKRGFGVVLASDGRDALAKFSPRIQLVLTDMMMPTMNGFAFIRALRARAPDIPIVATTGLGESVQGDILKALGVNEVLRKPYLPRELVRAVHTGLNSLMAV